MKGINQDNLSECHVGLMAAFRFLETGILRSSGIPHRNIMKKASDWFEYEAVIKIKRSSIESSLRLVFQNY